MRTLELLIDVFGEHADRMSRFMNHLERHGAKRHAAAGAKELLLASRAVIDSAIDTLDEGQTTPNFSPGKRSKASKINIED